MDVLMDIWFSSGSFFSGTFHVFVRVIPEHFSIEFRVNVYVFLVVFPMP